MRSAATRRGCRRLAAVAALALAVAGQAPAQAAKAEAQTRYTLANGCYSLHGPSGQVVAGAERVRMQATTLGSYLLYRPDRTFLAARDDGSVAPAPDPSPAADWRVREAGGGTFVLTPASAESRALSAGPNGAPALAEPGAAGDAAKLRFVPAQGCADYPEAPLNATGSPLANVPFAKVGGIVEGHMHWMTFEYIGGNFHCGRPWHPYGIAYALPDCSSVEGPQGSAAPVQNFLNFGAPASPHDTSGYPKLSAWGPGNLTYEGTYWRWVERAYLGGLRLMIMSVNENRVLCELQSNRRTNCDEMDTVRRGFQDIREMQRYVDAQAGGPGKGFFQIVTDPFQARRVINAGKMAVVLEVEVSEPFGCRGWETSTCDRAQVDRQLDEMYRAGVRSSLLLNKFDNPLTGVRFDGGPVGVVINAGNKNSAGSFWSARTCTGRLADNTVETFQPQSSAFLSSTLATMGVPGGAFPAYPPAPHCNTRGLTALGRHLVRRMMDLHMIVNPDHMSQAAVDDTLTLLETRSYSGVISPHGWMDPGNWPRLWKLGGMAFPGHSNAADYVKEWRKYRPKSTPYAFGWGYGADLGGLSHQPDTAAAGGIGYPFRSYDGRVAFERQRTGERTFDYNKDGVAQYGLYADWFNDLRRAGGGQVATDMWNGAEAYLQMWERAGGIRTRACAPMWAVLTPRGMGPLRLGERWETLLRRAGQPQQRSRAWSWCVVGVRNGRAADVAALSDAGTVELVGSTARGRSAAGRSVTRGARGLRPGITVQHTRRAAWVYVVRGGRIRAVAVASRSLARRPRALRLAVARLLSAQATQSRPGFVPSDAQAQAALRGAPTGETLSGSSDPRLNAKFALLCRLNVQGR
jgi:hypothetical protein